MTPMLLKSDDNPNGAPLAGFEAVWAQWRRDYPKWVADNLTPFFIPETSAAMMGGPPIRCELPCRSRWPAAGRWSRRIFAPRCGRSRFPRCSSTATATVCADRADGRALGCAHPRLPLPRLRRRAAWLDVHAYGAAPRRRPAVRPPDVARFQRAQSKSPRMHRLWRRCGASEGCASRACAICFRVSA